MILEQRSRLLTKQEMFLTFVRGGAPKEADTFLTTGAITSKKCAHGGGPSPRNQRWPPSSGSAQGAAANASSRTTRALHWACSLNHYDRNFIS